MWSATSLLLDEKMSPGAEKKPRRVSAVSIGTNGTQMEEHSVDIYSAPAKLVSNVPAIGHSYSLRLTLTHFPAHRQRLM